MVLQERQVSQHQVDELRAQLTEERQATAALKLQVAQSGSDSARHEQVATALQHSQDQCEGIREVHRQLCAEAAADGANWMSQEAALKARLEAANTQIGELTASAEVPHTGCYVCACVAQACSLCVRLVS